MYSTILLHIRTIFEWRKHSCDLSENRERESTGVFASLALYSLNCSKSEKKKQMGKTNSVFIRRKNSFPFSSDENRVFFEPHFLQTETGFLFPLAFSQYFCFFDFYKCAECSHSLACSLPCSLTPSNPTSFPAPLPRSLAHRSLAPRSLAPLLPHSTAPSLPRPLAPSLSPDTLAKFWEEWWEAVPRFAPVTTLNVSTNHVIDMNKSCHMACHVSGSLTAANWVSFDLNVSYSSCWGYSLINTLKLKKNQTSHVTRQMSHIMCEWVMPRIKMSHVA